MMITFYKKSSEGKLQYYTIHDRQGHLFSDYTFTVVWGVEQQKSREKQHTFGTREEMDAKLRSLIHIRIQSGYKVLYSYFRKNEYDEIKPILKSASSI